jgi:flagellar biosynthesis GTPase FlhF
VKPNFEERLKSYGIHEPILASNASTPRSITPPISATSATRRAPASIFISTNNPPPKLMTLKTPISTSLRGQKRENKIKMLDMNDMEMITQLEMNSKVEKENRMQRERAEKEAERKAAKEAKELELEEKRNRKAQQEQERRAKQLQKEQEKEAKRKRKSLDDGSRNYNVGFSEKKTKQYDQDDDIINNTDLSNDISQVQQPIKNNTANFDVSHVLAGADCLTPEEKETIKVFLSGNYRNSSFNLEMQQLQQEFKLTERVFTDPLGINKRECFYIILDYSNCKWRKVKRTSKII